jgi:hypothetical protein
MLHRRPTVPTGLDPAACVDQVDRVASSSLLEGSEALCRLMRYLAEHALEHPRAHLKEYQIATEVLGRSADFDPHSDSSVRVQIGRLRAKLAEYYGSEGLEDPILIDIPKGRYTLSFQPRQDAAQPAIQLVAMPDSDPAEPAFARRSRRKPLFIAIAGAAVAALALFLMFRHPHVVSSVLAKRKTPQPSTALEILWAPFLHGSSEPFVVFRNSSFVGDAATGMRRFDPTRDNPNQEVQHYTGIGEVMGVLDLDQLFGKFGGRFRVKRGSLFTVDDARENNLIFVGSPARNLDLNEIPSTHEFTFRRLSEGSHRVRIAIADSHPPAGAAALYARNLGMHTGEVEYALVGLERGLDPSHWTLFLEGTSTVATEAAVDFVCNESSVSDLLKRLQVKGTPDLKPFEGLIKVQVANDVPLETQLLDVRLSDRQN